jgi:thymidylate kinase
MKVVIIDGLDNVGKTTVIDRLIHRFNNVHYIHFQKPTSSDTIYAAIEQRDSFLHNVYSIVDNLSNTDTQIVILDRSWLGEYVYGCKYRNNGEEYVINMIDDCYKVLLDNDIECYTVILTVYNPEFCVKHEDGKSISSGKKEDIQDEIDRFESLYNIYKNNNMVNISKIVVNDRLDFRPKDDIFNDVLTAIHEQ